MASIIVSLSDELHDWVLARIKNGQYANASDYIKDLIRRDQAEDRQAIIAALIEGEKSGISTRGVPEILEALLKDADGKDESS